MAHNHTNHGRTNERTTLLDNTTTTKPPNHSPTTRLKTHFTSPVSPNKGYLALLFCYTITGLLDSSSVATWGSFVSMQTGNSIYLGSGLVAPRESDRWLRALLSICAFCLGAFAFGRFHRACGGRTRWVIVASYLAQFLFVLAAALVIQYDPQDSDPKLRALDLWTALPLVFLAFQAAGQAVISRVLGYGGLTSVVLTSIYCDLFSDEKLLLWAEADPLRNQRAAAIVLLLLGAMIGGLWAQSPIGLQGALWTAVGFKAVLVVTWCFWASDKEEDDETTD
ncbi:Hypothetical predicted protein [Lecanosticta acicola]|uniref:DUF1275 domain protein n=1 Tax=Lecanosticta acicola TaxID=111012 RepID=A0AAI9EC58_9PEZI|nr:Hypothetical predicted protein [Lecanosticta acicola]